VATYYVDSNATGLNDGSSWTDAWTSIASATGAAAGDFILVSHTHSETPSYPWPLFHNGTINNPIKLISTNSSTGQYAYGANLSSATVASFGGNIYCKGFDFSTLIYDLSFGGNSSLPRGDIAIFENCYFGFNRGSANVIFSVGNFQSLVKFVNCEIYSSGTGSIAFSDSQFWSGAFEFDNCIFDCSNAYINTSQYSEPSRPHLFRNCDLTNFSHMFVNGNSQRQVVVEDCNLNASFTAFNVTPHDEKLTVFSSDDAVLTGEADGVHLIATSRGEVTTSKIEYRSSGAESDVNYSWKLAASSLCVEGYNALDTIPISKYVESGSQTITVYVAGSSSLNDDDFWIEVDSPSEEVSPTAQGKFRTTKPEPLATPTALTSDTSSAWNGIGVGTKQKVEVAISPTIAGTVTVRCYLAKPSTTVYVDPKISTTGNQRVFNGVLVDTDESLFSVAGGGSSSPTYTSTAGTQMYPFRTLAEDDFDKGGTKFHPLS